jgi:hypothetical protein
MTDCTCRSDLAELLPTAMLRVAGLVLVAFAVGAVYDGWFVVGAIGLALLSGWLDGVPLAVRGVMTVLRAHSR